jgi:hypothetical protein
MKKTGRARVYQVPDHTRRNFGHQSQGNGAGLTRTGVVPFKQGDTPEHGSTRELAALINGN